MYIDDGMNMGDPVAARVVFAYSFLLGKYPEERVDRAATLTEHPRSWVCGGGGGEWVRFSLWSGVTIVT